jgi:hypothetical protein
MTEHLETLSALIDGEPVAIDALEAALANADARRSLVEFVRLRQLARDETAEPRPGLAERVGLLAHRRRGLARLHVPLPLAAAAVVLAVLGGTFIEVKWLAFEREQVQPPPASRVLQFDAPQTGANEAGSR